MQHQMSRRTVLALASLAGVTAAATAQAAPMSFTVPLTGAQQVPPVQTSGSGTADLTYNPSTRVLTWNITYSGLSGPATMAHIHGPAPQGKNAGIEIWLSRRGSEATSPITGRATLSATQARQLMAGDMYINVHTRAHPAGEIRGQIIPPKS
jgi:hypothetical protein